MADGSCATTTEERFLRWGTYFAEQEAGFALDEHEYVKAVSEQKVVTLQSRREGGTFEWRTMLTLPKAELLVMTQRSGKAAGYDGVTAEL